MTNPGTPTLAARIAEIREAARDAAAAEANTEAPALDRLAGVNHANLAGVWAALDAIAARVDAIEHAGR